MLHTQGVGCVRGIPLARREYVTPVQQTQFLPQHTRAVTRALWVKAEISQPLRAATALLLTLMLWLERAVNRAP